MHRHSTALNTWGMAQKGCRRQKKLTATPHPTPKPANPACKTAIRHPRRRVPERKTKNRRQSGCRLWRVSPVPPHEPFTVKIRAILVRTQRLYVSNFVVGVEPQGRSPETLRSRHRRQKGVWSSTTLLGMNLWKQSHSKPYTFLSE